ncbi:unnamed protein product, partial [marine sediment metagenome]
RLQAQEAKATNVPCCESTAMVGRNLGFPKIVRASAAAAYRTAGNTGTAKRRKPLEALIQEHRKLLELSYRRPA